MPKQQILGCIATLIMIIVFFCLCLIAGAFASFTYNKLDHSQKAAYWETKAKLLTEYKYYISNNKPDEIDNFKNIEEEFMEIVKNHSILNYYFNQHKFKVK